MDNRELLTHCGQALYGDSWKKSLAEALGVNDRTVRYWLAGREMRPKVWEDVRALLDERAARCQETAALIERERPSGADPS